MTQNSQKTTGCKGYDGNGCTPLKGCVCMTPLAQKYAAVPAR